MRIYKDTFWLIISPQALFHAWEVFRSDKRNKPDVAAFELDLEQNIFKLYRELKSGEYRHQPYMGFWIHDPKLRRIHKASVKDRVLHHAVFSMLNQIFEPTFISDSYSCRIGKGTHKGTQKVFEMVRKVSRNYTQPCYVLKCDVRRFFDSVDHDVLLEILGEKIKDEKTMSLLREIIESFETSRPNLFERKGVPIGNLTSQVFANIYMNVLDQFVKQELKVTHYARYTDDFVIVSTNEKYLSDLLDSIEKFLEKRLKLSLHPNKIEIRKHNRGVDFLGYVLFPHHQIVRAKTRRRMFRKLKSKALLSRNGLITKENLNQSLQSYLGVLSHGNSYRLSNDLKNKCWFWSN